MKGGAACDATSSARAAALMMMRGTTLSIALRLLSFVLNQLTVRRVAASTLGDASISLDLMLSTTLFVGREGLRLALTRRDVGDDDGDDDGGGATSTRSTGDDGRNEGGGGDDDDDDDGGKVDEGNGDGGGGGFEGTTETTTTTKEQSLVNASWLSVPIGAILSYVALFIHLRNCDSNAETTTCTEDYRLAGTLYCLASFVEYLSEPLTVSCLRRMDVSTRAAAEGAALLAKSAGCLCFLKVVRRRGRGSSYDVTAFGASQLAYAAVYTSTLYFVEGRRGGIRWPRYIPESTDDHRRRRLSAEGGEEGANGERKRGEGGKKKALSRNFDAGSLRLAFAFTLQGGVKHLLTEADKIALSALSQGDSRDKGVYALASGYGGLAARLLLQPVEENARLLFSRLGARVDEREERGREEGERRGRRGDGVGGRSQGKEGDQGGRGEDDDDGAATTSSSSAAALRELEGAYFRLMRAVVYVGLTFAALGSNYTSVLLRVLVGSGWGSDAEAANALSAFCVYTAFLALNGTAEAFVYGVARSGNDVGRIGAAHAAVGGALVLIAPPMVRRRGAAGLVAANSVAAAMRSAHSLQYARGYFGRHHSGGTATTTGGNATVRSTLLLRILPHPAVLGAFGASFAITKASERIIYDAGIAAGGSWMVLGMQHVAVGILCAVMIAALVLWVERDIRDSLLRLVKRKRD